jgi:hypothetical protein
MGVFLPGVGQLLNVSAKVVSGFRDPRLIQRSHQSVSIQNSVKRTAKQETKEADKPAAARSRKRV